MMKKQLYFLFLVFSLISSKLMAFDIKAENEDGVMLYYKYINDGKELEVTRNIYAPKYSGTIKIPESVTYMNATMNVTSIGKYAFHENPNLHSVLMPNGLNRIGENAFYGCSGLVSLNIPDNVEFIGEYAFYGCSGLLSITIGDSVRRIEQNAFERCSNLVEISIGNSVKSIESGAFQNCFSLKSVSIGNSVRYIGLFAFSGCKSLSSLVWGNNVTYIDAYAFEDCTSLSSIELPNTVTHIGDYAFYGCSGLKSIKIPNSVTTIDNYSFRGCTGLTSINIPSSVKHLGGSAFYSCSNLKEITIPSSVAYIGSNPFKGTAWYDNLQDGMIYKDNVFLGYKGEKPKNDITIQEGTRLIAGHALNDCELITSVSIPNTVISIGEFAFYNCKKLESIVIPNSVTQIGEHAFYFCTNLNTFTIPESVTQIGINAFKSTKWFYSLPDGIIYKDHVLLGYQGSSPKGNLNVSEGTRVIAESAMDRCEALTSITLPNSLEHIGKEAFTKCRALSSVCFGNSLKSIGYEAFSDCEQLKSITIPSTVTKIGDMAFANCTELKEVYSMNEHPNRFDYSAFMTGNGWGSYSKAILYVPVGSKEEYRLQEGWNFFSSILYDGEVIIYVKNCTREFGEKNPIFEYEICDGKIESGQPLLKCSASETSPVGTYDITIERGTLSNTIITSKIGTLTITKAPLTISTGNYTKKEGEKNPVFTPIITGFKNNDNINVLSKQPTISCTATTSSHAGIYPISVSGAEAQNYDINYKNGILRIKNKEDCAINGHEYIDLGLPSGRVWATMNYGATSEEDFGNYLKWSSRKEVEDNWGKEWSTPTSNDFKELIDNCNISWIVVGNSVNGVRVTGKNGKSIFLPATGYNISNTYQLVNQRICYWSDTMKEADFAYALDGSSETGISTKGSYNYIYVSLPIRPVANSTSSQKNFILTYFVDGITYKTVSYHYGETIIPETNPTKEGYTFSGWSEIPKTMPAHDVTVTGTFTINKYMLTYMVDGEEYKSFEVEYGASITPEAEPTKEGYTFSGWSWIPSKMPAEDVKITGSFSVNRYKLTYMINDKVYKEIEYDYGTSITPEAIPEGDYDIFEWIDLPATMPAHDVVVYAYYTTGFSELKLSQPKVIHFYSPDGKVIERLQKGLNIVRMSDGRTKKVVVK